MEHRWPGRLIQAPENFLDASGIRRVFAGRRDFIRGAFAGAVAAAAAVAAPRARGASNPVPADGGDPNILNLPEHSKGLGRPVVSDGYGKPSQYEHNVQRRAEPRADADAAGLGVVRAAAVPVRHHHAERPALRAPPPGLVGHRPVASTG